MLKILFAPLQGYTTGIYRKAHAEIFGGVDAYYAPFLRIENGKPREKDLRGGRKLTPIELPLLHKDICPTRIKFSIGMGFMNSWQ